MDIVDYGRITWEGATYILDDQADYTSRLLPDRQNWHEAAEGEEYWAEFSAPAHDGTGNKYTVYWMFKFRKGAEPELDTLDWDNVDRVEPAD